ncbi:MAG TPA: hypothetical protein VI912_01695 [Candidatus Bilamarchaeaceae archaeon]|nr:hypothetical protein [Candidatus Bilamarchaeaceae archaeon]
MHNLQLKATRVCNSARRPDRFRNKPLEPDSLSLKRADKPVAPLDVVIYRRQQEEERRREEVGIPLHIEVPLQIPPGWVPDPNSYGGYVREGDLPKRDSERGEVTIWM